MWQGVSHNRRVGGPPSHRWVDTLWCMSQKGWLLGVPTHVFWDALWLMSQKGRMLRVSTHVF